MIAKGAAKLSMTLSRREALVATPLLSGALSDLASPFPGRMPILIIRTREGRILSRSRYRNAESFFLAVRERRFHSVCDLLYHTGIVVQMALSSHLLDVGFDDRWCARNIGLHLGKALAYANATGFNYHMPELERLAVMLSPYNKWRSPGVDALRPSAPEMLPDIPPLLRDLLDHVRGVTGHPCPRRRKAYG